MSTFSRPHESQLAAKFEKNQRRLKLDGWTRGMLMDFARAAVPFIAWRQDIEHRQKPNTAQAIKVSFAPWWTFSALCR